MTRSHELLEHTADIGIRATGSTAEEAFAAAAEGLAEILGAWFPGEGEERPISLEASDREALLIAWLDELLYLHETGDIVFGGFEVRAVGWERLEAGVRAAPRSGRQLAQGVKAATYHQVSVAERGDRVEAIVYLDV